MLSLDKRHLYVTREEDIQIMDVQRGTVLHQYDFSVRAPEVAGTSADGRHLYVSGMLSQTVQVIDTQMHTIENGYKIGLLSGGMDVSPNGKQLRVAAREAPDNPNGALLIINAAEQTLMHKIPVGKNPEGIASHPTKPYIYITCAGFLDQDSGVYAINTDTSAVKRIPVLGDRGYIAISHDGKKLYVAQHNTRRISVIHTLSNQVQSEFIVEHSPAHLALNRNGQWLYVLGTDSKIRVFNTTTQQLAYTIDTGMYQLRGISVQLSNNVVWATYRTEERASQT